MKNYKPAGVVLVLLLTFYIGSYLILSAAGSYEPATIGLDHVKSYGWAPRGFYSKGQWRTPLMLVYVPLYYLDTHYWHPDK